ncbi:transglycosylase [Veillonella denticariosi JCM 15641]|uniref:Transglycosylase n=1 Tax=Veillonella denticariosi JCM 15641 TaxID=1298594 RepID=A0A2S7Z6Q0_9FIRM|nr:lytic transglycosylase domain-containing protein [Veillonella denticariosi]PQL18978.1 transglycosylase [Veillonella denticariosi JCM 15641]
MKRTTATALSCVILGWFYFTHLDDFVERQFVYPFDYREEVMAAAEKEDVSPALVASVILAESKYRNTAESETGALGLMQLMPETARWIAEQVGHGNYTDRQLKEPVTNIELGTWYLAHLLKDFNGDEVMALAAYNAGRGHVEAWLQENKWNGMVDTIPFPETRSYVKAVLQYQERYEALYGPDY